MKYVNKKTFVIMILSIWLFILIIVMSIANLQDRVNNLQDKDFDFKCNDYYDGKIYPERCANFFINKTGNYCNGILVCQNYWSK